MNLPSGLIIGRQKIPGCSVTFVSKQNADMEANRPPFFGEPGTGKSFTIKGDFMDQPTMRRIRWAEAVNNSRAKRTNRD